MNGNKRLALVIAITFAYENEYTHKISTKKVYANWLSEKFPDFNLSNTTFNKTYGWALYNLNKAIAASKMDFQELKTVVEDFLGVFYLDEINLIKHMPI